VLQKNTAEFDVSFVFFRPDNLAATDLNPKPCNENLIVGVVDEGV